MSLVRIAYLIVKQSGTIFTKDMSNRPVVHSTMCRNLSSLEISKNLVLITKDQKERSDTKPLVVILSWLLAKAKHINKFAEIYTEQGFDVLRVSISPWQLLWPTKGTQVVAGEVVKFLDTNVNYTPLVIHGFSVGAYQWGEVLVHLAKDQKRYQHVLDRISGQVWDSAADITEVWFGFPMAVFPKNPTLQNALKKYMIYHLKTFEKVATCHYVRSSQLFHSDLVKAPALFFLSQTDPVGAEKSNRQVREDWENAGIKVYWKCWSKSPHVSHLHYHRDEYLEQLNAFLANHGLTQREANVLKAKL